MFNLINSQPFPIDFLWTVLLQFSTLMVLAGMLCVFLILYMRANIDPELLKILDNIEEE